MSVCLFCGMPSGLIGSEANRPDSGTLPVVPELKGKKPLVLYFDNEVDRDEFVRLWKEVKPNARTLNL
jgi:hypothetical protein